MRCISDDLGRATLLQACNARNDETGGRWRGNAIGAEDRTFDSVARRREP